MAKKKLLFLYPIEEYFDCFADKKNHDEIFRKLNNAINKRYREKGYEIYFAVFIDSGICNIEVREGDKVILSNLTYKEHVTPDENGNATYSDPRSMLLQLGEVEELILCGFHSRDCVKVMAESLYNLGVDVMIDIELTELFPAMINNDFYDEANYNLKNIISAIKGTFANHPNIKSFIDRLYCEPYYKRDVFEIQNETNAANQRNR